MSARLYSFTGTVEDGEKSLGDMLNIYDKGYVSLTFYSDSSLTQIVNPTGGTVVVTVSEDGTIFGTIPAGTVDANSVGQGRSYTRPNWGGVTTHIKLTFLSITYATHFKCDIARSGGA